MHLVLVSPGYSPGQSRVQSWLVQGIVLVSPGCSPGQSRVQSLLVQGVVLVSPGCSMFADCKTCFSHLKVGCALQIYIYPSFVFLYSEYSLLETCLMAIYSLLRSRKQLLNYLKNTTNKFIFSMDIEFCNIYFKEVKSEKELNLCRNFKA